MKNRRNVFIFHISEFGGHSKAAQNIREALHYKDPSLNVTVRNGLGYFYPRAEKVIDFIYNATIKHCPRLWGKAYDRKCVIRALAPCRKLVNRMAFWKFKDLISPSNANCFVATQAFPCGVIGDFKMKYGLSSPLVAVVTDYHPHRFWVHPAVDRYVVACQEARDVLVGEGVEQEKIKILGIPISVNFLASHPRDQASREFGFSSALPSVLIMGGGLGWGPLKAIARRIDSLNEPVQIVVVCGRNRKLYDWFIKNKSSFSKPMFVFGYTEHIHRIMDFCDIIITKCGGVTISEALAKGLCIVITDTIPGQEERNVEHLLKHGAAKRAEDVEDVSGLVEWFLKDKQSMYAFRERAKEISLIDSSVRIVDLISSLIS